MNMPQRTLGPFRVGAIGLGCMNICHAYGVPPPREQAIGLLRAALDAGVTHFDSAALYGFGASETLLGEVLGPRRQHITLASKCGMTVEAGDGSVRPGRVIDGRPEALRATCEGSLRRLRTDVIDLYYLHRWDRQVPIEDSVGALADLVRAGKIRAIGLSEVSAATLRRAHAVHPIAALQTEYSLWTRNPEIAVLAACRELGVSFVAFSPVARGFLAGALPDQAAVDALPDKDLRRPCRALRPRISRATCGCWTAFAPSPPNWAAPRRSWPWPGCCIRAKTSCPFPARAASPTCTTTWAPPPCGCRPPHGRAWTR